MSTLSNTTLQPKDLTNQWFGWCGYGGKDNGTYLGNFYLSLHFLLYVPMLLLWCLSPV